MSQETKFCKHCGQAIDADCVVCPKCGKQVEELKSSNNGQPIVINNNNNNSSSSSAAAVAGGFYGELISPKSWLVTLLLCIFLGGVGGHRFYAGKIGTAIIMILLCWTGISVIWAVIDLIFIIIGRFKDKQGRPIKR